MKKIPFTTARKNFAATIEKVCRDHKPVIITRKDGKAVVLMSLQDYSSQEETFYLMSSPANHLRLLEGIQELRKA